MPPKEGGDMALLIGCVKEAKQFSNTYLTKVVKDEKVNRPTPTTNNNHTKKKSKQSR